MHLNINNTYVKLIYLRANFIQTLQIQQSEENNSKMLRLKIRLGFILALVFVYTILLTPVPATADELFSDAHTRQLFTSYDVDGNGYLAKAEFIDAKFQEYSKLRSFQKMSTEAKTNYANFTFQVLDENKDQKLSFEEYKKQFE